MDDAFSYVHEIYYILAALALILAPPLAMWRAYRSKITALEARMASFEESYVKREELKEHLSQIAAEHTRVWNAHLDHEAAWKVEHDKWGQAVIERLEGLIEAITRTVRETREDVRDIRRGGCNLAAGNR